MVTAEFVPTCKSGQLDKYLSKRVTLYARGGFIVRLALMDKEFDNIENVVDLLETNTTVAARVHIGKIEGGQAN